MKIPKYSLSESDTKHNAKLALGVIHISSSLLGCMKTGMCNYENLELLNLPRVGQRGSKTLSCVDDVGPFFCNPNIYCKKYKYGTQPKNGGGKLVNTILSFNLTRLIH